MSFHINEKIKITIAFFAVAFIAIIALFIRKPHIMKTKNRCVRTAMVFAIAFVPGVLAASICAQTITAAWGKLINSESNIAVEKEVTEENDERETERDDEAVCR